MERRYTCRERRSTQLHATSVGPRDGDDYRNAPAGNAVNDSGSPALPGNLMNCRLCLLTMRRSLLASAVPGRAWDRGIGKTRAKILHGVARPGFNLFCGGHTFLADGRLFSVGGHILDSVGEKRAAIYNPEANTWTEATRTNKGRWYPTLITLADGGVLVISGSFTGGAGGVNTNQQVWKDGFWRSSGDHLTIPLYPRMHLTSDGRVAHYRFEPKRELIARGSASPYPTHGLGHGRIVTLHLAHTEASRSRNSELLAFGGERRALASSVRYVGRFPRRRKTHIANLRWSAMRPRAAAMRARVNLYRASGPERHPDF
jgi:hypothetical protein